MSRASLGLQTSQWEQSGEVSLKSDATCLLSTFHHSWSCWLVWPALRRSCVFYFQMGLADRGTSRRWKGNNCCTLHDKQILLHGPHHPEVHTDTCLWVTPPWPKAPTLYLICGPSPNVFVSIDISWIMCSFGFPHICMAITERSLGNVSYSPSQV